MKRFATFFSSISLAASAFLLAGCIDDNYDLSDIDTTVRVPVNDLVIPINIDAVQLKNIMDLSETSVIKVINGQYTVQYDGNFESSPIKIDPIVMGAPNLPIRTSYISTAGAEQAFEQVGQVELPLPTTGVDFSYSVAEVSTDIESITEVGTVFTIRMIIGIDQGNTLVNEVIFKNLKFQLPKGLTMVSGDGQYDPTTGIYTVPDAKSTADIRREVDFSANAVDIAKAGVKFENHKLSYSDEVKIVSGDVLVKRENLKVDPKNLPSTILVYNDFKMSEINVNWMSGRIHYAIENFQVPDVEITGLPGLLNQDNTNILLDNPQIYLNINNPVGIYGLTAKTGLAITPWRGDVASSTCRLNNGFFVIPATSAADDPIKFCLAPADPMNYPAGYESPQFEPFSALSDVLAGNGLPQRLQINLENPEIPSQMVRRLPIGQIIGSVGGSYMLNAPLNLKAGSTIFYTDRVDGWSSEDLDAVTITTLTVTARVNTDIPLKAVCTGYPIDKDGKQINNVTIEGAEINANAKDQVITIRITGEIHNLDGLVFTVRIDAENGETLNENMSISLTDIRPKVSGYYQKKL